MSSTRDNTQIHLWNDLEAVRG